MRLRPSLMLSALALGLAASGGAQAAKINLINTGGVEVGTDAYTGFAAAAHFWETVLTDNVTLNFRVGFTSAGFDPNTLGQTGSASGNIAQSQWRTALTGDAKTALDASVTANLPTFSSTTVNLNTSVQKALGIYTGTESAIDATITFNSARAFDFDPRDGFQTVASDFISVATHEMGHALGFTSAVGTRTTLNSRPSNTDLFRYKDGQWDITYAGKPYFSIDGGKTEYLGNAGFSAGPDGFQTSHWREGSRIHDGVSCTQLTEAQVGIMDPTGGLCQEGIVTAQDVAIFDAMGWDLSFDILSQPGFTMTTSQILGSYLSALPEPSTWASMVIGFGLIGGAIRRSRLTVRFA